MKSYGVDVSGFAFVRVARCLILLNNGIFSSFSGFSGITSIISSSIWEGVVNNNVKEVMLDCFHLFFAGVWEILGLRKSIPLQTTLASIQLGSRMGNLEQWLIIAFFLRIEDRTREVSQFQLRRSVRICIAQLINSDQHTPIFSRSLLRHKLG